MINREAVVSRHHVQYSRAHLDAPLSVGNGEFAFTVDITGLQTFATEHEREAGRRAGIPVMPLGTQAQWSQHWAPNPQGWTLDDTMESFSGPRGVIEYPTAYDFRRDRVESEAAGQAAGYYFWANPQRTHLARIAFAPGEGRAAITLDDIDEIEQTANLWDGVITSRFRLWGQRVTVTTAVHPERDALAVKAASSLLASGDLRIEVAFPAVEESFEAPPVWDAPESHRTVVHRREQGVDISRTLDETRYHARLRGFDPAALVEQGPHAVRISSNGEDELELVAEFTPDEPQDPALTSADEVFGASRAGWHHFWTSGAAVDLAGSTDPRAAELERRIVLSQYQTAVHCSGSTPPQETGLVCNSWGGTFHLEMHWWHAAHFAAWGRPELLERSFRWYHSILPVAQSTAAKQGFEGARWPKHVGVEGIESPNEIGPLLLWQQPHPIHLAELLFTASADPERVLDEHAVIVEQTAVFLASFAWKQDERWHLPPPLMPAQEIYGIESTWDPLFELAYVRWALLTAQLWRERRGLDREPAWDEIASGLQPTVTHDGDDAWYDAVQRPPRTAYTDHPSMVGALGVVPDTGAIDPEIMWRTLERVTERWSWQSAWGWDFPMLSMCATRSGRSDAAVDLLLRDAQKNTHLPNGHNVQVPTRLPLYLPGNGGLLMAVALLFGGWTDSEGAHVAPKTPTGWQVRAEGFPPRP